MLSIGPMLKSPSQETSILASSTMTMRPIASLPEELRAIIVSQLSGTDIKNLRLASKATSQVVPLRLERVFVSANLRNIEVFRAVADHETFRWGVKEIIWDDARLEARFETGFNRTTSELQNEHSDHDLGETHDLESDSGSSYNSIVEASLHGYSKRPVTKVSRISLSGNIVMLTCPIMLRAKRRLKNGYHGLGAGRTTADFSDNKTKSSRSAWTSRL